MRWVGWAVAVCVAVGGCAFGPEDDPVTRAAGRCGYDELEDLLANGGDPNRFNEFGDAALHDAVRAGKECLDVLDLLVEYGADPTALTDGGDSALVVLAGSAAYKHDDGGLSTAQWLLDHRVDPCMDVAERRRGDGSEVSSVVDLAEDRGNVDLVEYLTPLVADC